VTRFRAPLRGSILFRRLLRYFLLCGALGCALALTRASSPKPSEHALLAASPADRTFPFTTVSPDSPYTVRRDSLDSIAVVRQLHINDSLRALGYDTIPGYAFDSLGRRRDSLTTFGDSLEVDTTWVPYLDSTARMEQFVHRRTDDPTAQFFLRPAYSLYASTKSPAYKRELSIDSTGQYVTIRETVNGLDVKVPVTLTLDEYIHSRYAFEQGNGWRSMVVPYQFKDRRDELGGLLSNFTNIEIPVPANPLFSIFGRNVISLKVSGAVDIRFGFKRIASDQSTGTQQNQIRNEPNFNQDVRVNVSGGVGDKLNILADWNTERTFDYENQLKIKYTGYEDEIVQSVEAGNVSLQTPSLVGGGQALFGIKAKIQAGPLTLTTLLSQKKGQTKELSLKGGQESKTTEIMFDRYATNHFLLDPVYAGYWEEMHKFQPTITPQIEATRVLRIDVYRLFVENPSGSQDLVDADAYVDLPAHLYNGTGYQPSDVAGLRSGEGYHEQGKWIRLVAGKDYKFDDRNSYDGHLTILTSYNDATHAIAVAYTIVGEGVNRVYGDSVQGENRLVLKLIKPKDILNHPNYDPAWSLLLKNIYPLGGRDLKKDGFDLKVYRRTPGLPDQDAVLGVSIMEAIGLDRFDANNAPTPNNEFDFIPGLTVDPERGEITFPTLRPLDRGIQQYFRAKNGTEVSDSLLFGDIYDTTASAAQKNSFQNRYVMAVKFSSSVSSSYNLGFNVVEGSVQVLYNGTPLVPNTDYTVDYIGGQVTIRKPEALVPGADIQVKYEQNDLFQLASKTLIGARGELALIPKTNIGFTVMTLSQATLSDKVRLGEEPTKNLILGADVSSSFDLPFLTDAIDALPFLRTREMSTMRFTGEAAYMLPDPNTKKSTIPSDGGASIAYLDDFEGARRTIPMSVFFSAWTPASPPVSDRFSVPADTQANWSRGRLLWYNRPNAATIKEIWPLKEARPGQDIVQVLDMDFYPSRRAMYNFAPDLNESLHRNNPALLKNNWNGVMRYIGQTAGSLLEQNVTYLEIWMKASAADSINLRSGRMMINIGRISEDVILDGKLNSEDYIKTPSNPTGLPNGILNKAEEDLGLDMMSDADEIARYQDFVTANAGDPDVDPNDPAGDDYSYKGQGDYTHRNGTEKNAAEGGDASGLYPNTEDLNSDYNLNTSNEYLEYEVPLDRTYIDSTGTTELQNGYIVGGGNNRWYQYRIPLLEPTRIIGGAASAASVLQSVQYFRMWFAGFKDSVNIRIADMGFVGNQWEERVHSDSVMKVSVVSIEDNPGYVGPPGVEREKDRTQPDQIIQGNEQSLELKLHGMAKGDSRQVVKKFITRPLDLFNYKSMKMFVHGDPAFSFQSPDQYDAEVFIRFGADSLNFYEYRTPIRPGWDPQNEISIVFAQITSLKAARDSVAQYYRVPVENGPPGATYSVQGNPSLRQIREISIGIANPSPQGGQSSLSGDVWVNELRLVDVNNDPGLAYRFDTQVKLADFGTFAFNYSKVDPNFHALTDRFGSQLTGINWSVTTSFSLDKFFPSDWQGTSIPFAYSHTENISKPKYLPNTDVVVDEAASRAGARAAAQGGGTAVADSIIRQSQTLHVQNTYAVQNLRIAIPTQRWYIRETINKLSFSFSYNNSNDRDPSIEFRNAWLWNARAGYAVTLPQDGYVQPFRSLFAGIFLLREFKDWKLYYLPFQNLHADISASRSRNTEVTRLTSALPRDTRSFGASKSIGFGWKLTEGGLLSFGGEYSLGVDRNLQPLDNDSVGRTFGAILKSVLFGGTDRNYRQRVTVNLKPKIPNILDVTKYLDLQASYGVNYNWQNNFQPGDQSKSSSWDNTATFGFGFRLKSLADTWFKEDKEAPPPPKPAPRRVERDTTGTDSTGAKKAEPLKEEEEASKGKPLNVFAGLKTLARYAIKYPFLDYENISIGFTQNNRVSNTGIVGTTGFRNFWGTLPFSASREEYGPSRLYQLGFISDPSGYLKYSPTSSFPFVGWRTVPGRRAAGAVLTDQFSQANGITLKTNRPLWTGATLEINWKVAWQFNKSTSFSTDAAGYPIRSTISTSGNVERSFITLPPILFFKVFKSNLEDVGKRYDALSEEDQKSNSAVAESFEKGFEAMPFLSKLFGQYVPRPNWAVRWDGVERTLGFSSIVERMSLEHSYVSGFRRDFRGLPSGEEQTDAERITYGFSPLARVNATFKQFMKGNLTGSILYNTTTSYDLNLNASSKNIVETLAQEMSVTLTFNRRGFSFPLFGLNLSNDIDVSFTYSRTKNSKRQHLLQYLSSTQDGTPLDGNTRTTIEPRVKYVLSTRVSAGMYYRYTRIAPDEGGSFIVGNSTNEAGVDIHISI
jgi:cell surface protein SprA